MEHLNKIFTKHIDEGRFPGVQWQINIKDETYSGKVGYNDVEKKETVLENTIYRIWSMTKPVVAVAALQLLEQNKINLDDLVTKYLPEFMNLKVLKKEFSSRLKILFIEITAVDISNLSNLSRRSSVKENI